MDTKNTYCVIMAGGVGSRFWPMSTTKYPKQYHDILGLGKSLLQMTYERLLQLAPKENIFVITNVEYVAVTQSQLPDLSENQIVGEPSMMNTAACNMYMAEKIYHLNPNATILVAPSDHLILEENAFLENAQIAIDHAAKEDILVTLGIEPTRPDTGYGYIQFVENDTSPLKKVKTFTEKPNLELAEKFIESGDFLWNAGIFVWSASSILNAFKKYLPEMYETFHTIESYNTPQEYFDIEPVYSTVTKTSIDYGIMEKADNVYVIPSSFGWSDLGTWASLFENFHRDENNNAVRGKWVKAYDSENNIIQTSENKAVIVSDLNGYIVADTPKALLICPIDQDQRVKEFVKDLRINKGEDFI